MSHKAGPEPYGEEIHEPAEEKANPSDQRRTEEAGLAGEGIDGASQRGSEEVFCVQW